MNITLLIIESVIISLLFSLGIFIPLYKNPVGQIMSYPKKIRERVESLDRYKDSIKKREKKHLSIKILSVFIFALLLFIIAYLSGQRTFTSVTVYVFLIFLFVNLYDLIVMDLIIFRNVKAFRIPGTEDMDKEYKDPTHHIVGFFIGCLIGLATSLIAGLYLQIFELFL